MQKQREQNPAEDKEQQLNDLAQQVQNAKNGCNDRCSGDDAQREPARNQWSMFDGCAARVVLTDVVPGHPLWIASGLGKRGNP